MPPFPERDSTILAILKKKRPGRVVEPLDVTANREGGTTTSATTTASAPSHQQNGQTDLLVDVLGDVYSQPGGTAGSVGLNSMNSTTNSFASGSSVEVDNLKKLIWKNNGVLFENDLLQIGVKAEFRANLGRMTLFYGNKTAFPFVVSVV